MITPYEGINYKNKKLIVKDNYVRLMVNNRDLMIFIREITEIEEEISLDIVLYVTGGEIVQNISIFFPGAEGAEVELLSINVRNLDSLSKIKSALVKVAVPKIEEVVIKSEALMTASDQLALFNKHLM